MSDNIERASDDGLTLTLWTRRPVCGPRTTIIDRLSALRTAGAISDFSINTWPEEIGLGGRGQESELLETIDRFEQWAADHGLSLRPPFETRTSSLLVGGSEEVLLTPMLLVAVYEDGELVAVYPCTDGEYTWTVTEFLDGLEADAESAVTLPEPVTIQ